MYKLFGYGLKGIPYINRLKRRVFYAVVITVVALRRRAAPPPPSWGQCPRWRSSVHRWRNPTR